MRLTNLAGSLTVEHITRQSIFDASYVCACNNCGKAIVNIATVKDDKGTIYAIGLDCKKQLIDKPVIDAIKLANNWDADYKIKDFKKETSHAEKFLRFASNSENTIEIDLSGNWINIKDNKPNTQFPELNIIGNSVYAENLGYLFRLGFKGFINELLKTGKATTY